MHNSAWLFLYDNCKKIDFNKVTSERQSNRGRCSQLLGIGITKHGRVKFIQFIFLQLLSEHITLIEHTRFEPIAQFKTSVFSQHYSS